MIFTGLRRILAILLALAVVSQVLVVPDTDYFLVAEEPLYTF